MATNADVVDTFNALLDSVDSRTLSWFNDKVIDKKKRVEILVAQIPVFAAEAFSWQKTKAEAELIACQQSKCEYEVSTILPLEATKLQLGNKLIQCQGDKCCYELEHILPAQKAQIECETSKCTYEVTNILPAQKAQIECQTSKCTYEIQNILPAQKAQIECQTSKCSYEVSDILPAQKAKIVCETSKCTYEVQYILPTQKAQIECQTSKCTYEVQHLLPSQKSKIDCETQLCGVQKSELALNGTSTRALNTIKGQLYTRQKEGFTDKQQQDMIDKLIDIWTVTVSQEISDENAQMNLTKRNSSLNQISEVECAINSVAQTIDALTCVDGVVGHTVPISYPVTVSTFVVNSKVFTPGTGVEFKGTIFPQYTLKIYYVVGNSSYLENFSLGVTPDVWTITIDGVNGAAIQASDTFTIKEYNSSGTFTNNILTGTFG